MAVPVLETSHRTTKDYHSTTGSLSITTPASGELIVVVAACATTTYYTNVISCSGYTKVVEYYDTSDGPNVALFWKVSDGTETSVAITTSVSAENAIQAFIISGADTTNPINVYSGTSSSFRATSVSVRQVTTTKANTLAIGCDMSIGDQTSWSGGNDGNVSPWTSLGTAEGSAIGDFDIGAAKYNMASAGDTPTASFSHYQYVNPCNLTFAVNEYTTHVNVTGSEGTGEVGSVSVTAKGKTTVSGTEASAEIGSVTMTGDSHWQYAVGEEAGGAVGSMSMTGDAHINMASLSMQAEVSDLILNIAGNVTAVIFGVEITSGILDSVYIPQWAQKVPTQTSGFSNISPTQDPGWGEGSIS